MRGKVGPLLANLKSESRIIFRRKIRLAHASAGNDYTGQGEAVAEMLGVLEYSAHSWIAGAVDGVSEISTAPAALSLINEALSAHVTELSHDIEELLCGSIFRLDHGKIGEIRRRLERQLDGYRDVFRGDPLQKDDASGAKRGPKGKHDWLAATNVVWGRIVRGNLIPTQQSDIELALVEALSPAALKRGGQPPEPSNTRDYARLIWQEYKAEPQDDI